MNTEKAFREWLENYPAHKYSEITVNNYVNALKKAPVWFNTPLSKPIFEIDSSDDFQSTLRTFRNVKEFIAINMSHGHGTFSAAASAYQKFLNSRNDFSWTACYAKLADALLLYENRRIELIEIIVRVYKELNMQLPTLDSVGIPTDIDPFTVFGLFNKGITGRNRVRILKGLVDALEVKTEIPTTFPGVPLVNNLSATFYRFQDERQEHDIDKLWDAFQKAIAYADDKTEQNKNNFIRAYDVVLPMDGIRWNITMGLFWIRPYTFLNLDSRNRWFIKDTKTFPDTFVQLLPLFDKVPNGEKYLEICKDLRSVMESNELPFSNFPELSALAWIASEEENRYNNNNPITPIGDPNVQEVHYWLYSPGSGAEKWEECRTEGIMTIGWSEIGDFMQFASREDVMKAMKDQWDGSKTYKNSSLAAWQFSHVIKPGDIVFAKRGRDTILGRGLVQGDYQFDAGRTDDYKNIRSVHWTHTGEWKQPTGLMALKTLTDISAYTDDIEKLNALFAHDSDDSEDTEILYPEYTQEDFLSEVYMSREDYETLSNVLLNKKNIILQGAPGVGKTFAAKRLAYSIMGEKNTERVQMIQFHQSYSYEDFIEGYRPANSVTEGANFILKKGSFYKFCKKAADDGENEYFFIIDEINRGNLSKIFGELFMLIESDKRGVELQLLYSDEKFCVPKNVYLIGLMNTADRSLAMLDYALRRRFAFFDLKPGFETDGFESYRESLNSEKFDRLISCVKQLNISIAQDDSLGEGFCIGHSYFCGLTPERVDDRTLSSIVEFELLPLLREYWYDEPDKTNEWKVKLRGAIR